MRRPRLPRANDFLPRAAAETARPGVRQRGQALVLFALMALVMVGSVAIVTDVSWLWYGQQRMQRAADAAALAGAIYLPGDPSTAFSKARAEAAKNGFTNGSNGVLVTPMQDSRNRRRLAVTVSGPVSAYFSRALGIAKYGASATGKAEFVLPVPMGSPQNYYGVGHFIGVQATTSSNTTNSSSNTGYTAATTWPTGSWTTPSNANGTQDTAYAVSPTANNSVQQFGSFNLTGGALPALGSNQTMSIDGIQLEIRGLLTGSGTSTTCNVTSELSWDGGGTWGATAPSQTFTTTKTTYTQGGSGSTGAWGSHGWSRSDFTNLRVRLTWVRAGSCASTRTVSMDTLRINVYYTIATTTTTTTYAPQVQGVDGPGGSLLAPQNFWGAMQSQGAPNIQGDAFSTKYDTRTSTLNPAYDYPDYYNYGIDMPAGATGGKVWVYDPGECDVSASMGTGENWNASSPLGNTTRQPASAYYDLFDTQSTPYESSDDSLIASSGSAFRRMSLTDTLFQTTNNSGYTVPSGFTDCSGLSWHNGWWLLASGLSGGSAGRTYRLHTYSTDTSTLSDQDGTTALNSFAIFSSAAGGTPKVYGIGAMEAYVRLPASTSSEFYLAKIEAVHAGKTMVIDLWDPGDTGSLSATLEILKPGSTDYVPATFSYTAAQGTTNSGASSCNSIAGTSVTSVVTNTGGSSRFNGCWLTITIPLPGNYNAPHPSNDTVTSDGGWWKIRYTMGGSAGSFSTDLTTWKVAIRGNPVHLVQ